jgi:N-methylhydantoinase A
MGGTSCDVCVILDGSVREAAGREVGGRPVALPMLDLHTVGAGGGSIGWRDAGGALRAGPRSAGARPGPACYGHGGTEPTVTDANLLLGLLAPGAALGGEIELDRDAAAAAIGDLASTLDLEPLECAEGIRRVANAEMVRALRVMTVERGVDPRELALLAFGGAGGLHAADIADELGMRRMLCPRASGVLAALGLVVSERRRDAQRSVLLAGEELTGEALEREARALAGRAREQLGCGDAELRVTAELRYRGQAFELAVEAHGDADALREAFHAAHEEADGFRDPEGEVELVTLRATATEPGPDVDAAAAGAAAAGAERSTRTAVFGGCEHEASILTGEPAPGTSVAGPALVELPEATLAVPPGWAGEVLDSGTIRLERS